MKQTPADLPELYQMLMRISNKINHVERTLCDFGVPEPLYVSEMHTLQAIGRTPDNNVGIIADLTGVTPSAASQVITKLTKRGLVQKVRGARNDKEILLKLTPLGLIAYHNHEKIHAEKCEGIFRAIGPLSEEERSTLERAFSSIELYYNKSIEENSRAAKKAPQTFCAGRTAAESSVMTPAPKSRNTFKKF